MKYEFKICGMKKLINICCFVIFIAILTANITTVQIANKSYVPLQSLLLVSNASTEVGAGLCEQIEEITSSREVITGHPEWPDGVYITTITTKDCWDNGDSDQCESGQTIVTTNIVGQVVDEQGSFQIVTSC